MTICLASPLQDKAQRPVSSAAGQGEEAQRPPVGGPAAGSFSSAVASPAQGRTPATAPTPPPSAPADLDQVAHDPAVMGGKPCIHGLLIHADALHTQKAFFNSSRSREPTSS